MIKARAGNRRHFALAMISAALLAFQIALLQVLATSQWHHFAYFVISCALLGFGASGTAISLLRAWMIDRQDVLLPSLLCLSAVMLAASLRLIESLVGNFDSLLLFVNPGEMLRLVNVAFLFMLPFFFGALAIGLIFVIDTERIGSYYFANMLGSGLGSILALVGLAFLLPQQLIPLCALLALASAAMLLKSARLSLLSGMFLTLALVGHAIFQPVQIPISQYKDLSRTLDLPEVRIISHAPSAYGQIHLVSSPALRSAAALSLNWQGQLHSTPAVFVNGNIIGSLPPVAGSDNPRDAATYALPYALHTPRNVLALNAGTGTAVAQALGQGARHIVAVEPHTTLIENLSRYAPSRFGRIYKDSRVTWKTVASRTWLARDEQKYDLVILPDVGGFGGNAGLFALDEQPLLTREALGAAIRRLTSQGILSITSWVDYPVRNPARLLASLVEALKEAGADDPGAHIAAIRSWGTVTFCIKRLPYTSTELAKIRGFAKRWAFDPIILPDLQPIERQTYNRLQDSALFDLFDTILGKDRESLYRTYDFRVWPVDDDKPFFSQFLRWDRLETMSSLYGQQTLPFLELGLLIAGLAALVLTILSALLIILPLTRLPRAKRQAWKTLLYFGGLGLGYMWTELAMIHRFIFYLGQPIHAAALVVGVMLAGSAVGSALSDHIKQPRPRRWTATAACYLLFYALFMTPLLQATLLLPLTARMALAVLVIAPAAVIMGIPFPLGLRLLNRTRPAEVPWAWGINGCLSVVGAAIATLIAVEVGYSNLLVLAAGAYLATIGTGVRIANFSRT